MAVLSKKILVADDDATARRTLERYLTSEGYTITTAADANEALLAVHVDAPDIILSDIYMPGKTGLELQESLKGLNIHVPIIFMTGHDDMPTTIKAMQQGAYDYLSKPIDLARLSKILER